MLSDTEIMEFKKFACEYFPPPVGFSPTETELYWEPTLKDAKDPSDLEPMLMNPLDALMLKQPTFIFCLPAYMVGGLKWRVFAIDSIFYLLYTPGTPWDAWNPDDWRRQFAAWHSLMMQLSYPQKRVIRVWLELMALSHPTREMSDDYRSTDALAERVKVMLANYWGSYDRLPG